MLGFVIRLILGLILILLGIFFGSILCFIEFVIPMGAMYYATCSEERAQMTVDAFSGPAVADEDLSGEDEKYKEGRAIAALFICFYRLGQIWYNDKSYRRYFISAIVDQKPYKSLYNLFERRK